MSDWHELQIKWLGCQRILIVIWFEIHWFACPSLLQIQVSWLSIVVRLKRFVCQAIWDVNWFEIQMIWLSFNLKFKRPGPQLIWDSSDLVVNWRVTQLILAVIGLKFKWLGSQLIWDSRELVVNWFEIQMIWLSTDLKLKWLGCQLIWDSKDLVVDGSEMQVIWLRCQLIWNSNDLVVNWSEIQAAGWSTDVWLKWFWLFLDWVSSDLDCQATWASLIWLSIALRVEWFGCRLILKFEMIWLSSDANFKWFDCQLVWKSNDVIVDRSELQVIWLSLDFRWKCIVSEPLQIPHACQRFCNPHKLLCLPRILKRIEIPAPATGKALWTHFEPQKTSRNPGVLTILTSKLLSCAGVVQILVTSTSKSALAPSVFKDFDFQIVLARRRGANFGDFNFQKCSDAVSF